MRTIALLISNEQERSVLEHYFQSLSYKVLVVKTSFATFRTLLDTHPLCVICEMPAKFADNLHIIRMLNGQKKSKNIPIIAFGNHTAPSIVRSFYEAGVALYYQRPLQIKLLLENIDDIKDGKQLKNSLYRSNSDSQSNNSEKQQAGNQAQDRCASQDKDTTLPSQQRGENNLTVNSDELNAVERLMNPETTPDERIGIIISRVKEMLAFPFTIVKILEITQNDQTGAVDLAKAIEADPVVVSSLLSISNTIYYARQGKRINKVQEAIVRLGFVETKNIALSLSILSIFSNDAKSEDFSRFEFWYHSLACGILSETFARMAGFPNPEKAFICGLLHDFGIILLDEFFNTFFTSIYSQVSKNKSSFISEEKRLWGMSHNTAVAQLFKSWNMPQDITCTISQLDQFGSKQSQDPENSELLLVNIIGFSNLLAKSLLLGSDCDNIIYPVNNKVLSILHCPDGIDDKLLINCMDRLNVYTDFFNLEKRNFTYPPVKKPDAPLLSIIHHTKEMFFPYENYLSMCGYAIDKTTEVSKEDLIKRCPEVILNLIDSSIPEKSLESYANIPRNTQERKTEQFIPAIFIFVDNKPNLNVNSHSNTYSLPASVDMHILLSTIKKMISRQEIKNYNELTCQEEVSHQQERILSLNYINNQTAVISLKGKIRLHHLNEIRSSLSKMLEQKVPFIAFQLNDVVEIDNLMTNLLVNFQKKAAEKGCTICFCCIGRDPPEVIRNSETLKSIHYFHQEHELVTFFSSPRFSAAST